MKKATGEDDHHYKSITRKEEWRDTENSICDYQFKLYKSKHFK